MEEWQNFLSFLDPTFTSYLVIILKGSLAYNFPYLLWKPVIFTLEENLRSDQHFSIKYFLKNSLGKKLSSK